MDLTENPAGLCLDPVFWLLLLPWKAPAGLPQLAPNPTVVSSGCVTLASLHQKCLTKLSSSVKCQDMCTFMHASTRAQRIHTTHVRVHTQLPHTYHITCMHTWLLPHTYTHTHMPSHTTYCIYMHAHLCVCTHRIHQTLHMCMRAHTPHWTTHAHICPTGAAQTPIQL
jgi:hypothetical protein